jgi:hypothetical protein
MDDRTKLTIHLPYMLLKDHRIVRCGCSEWYTESSDDNERVCCVKPNGLLKCCSAGVPVSTCGSMSVCRDHMSQHQVESPGRRWRLLNEYNVKFDERIKRKQFVLYATFAAHGPVFYVSIVQRNTVDSWASAIQAAIMEPNRAEWWFWVAGWYDDCPEGVVRHF